MEHEEIKVEQGTTERPIFPKSILAIAGDPIYEDESESAAGSLWPLLGLIALVLAFLVWDIFRMMDHYEQTQSFWGSLDYASIVFVLFALYYLIGQAMVNYRFQLTEQGFVVRYRTIFGEKRHEIAYANIYGVHPHKARLANNVKFRYKWRWYSLMDSRPLMAIFYKIPREGKKPQFGRILFKSDPQFLLGLNEYLPARVGITEEETTYHVLIDESQRMNALEKEKEQRKAARKKV